MEKKVTIIFLIGIAITIILYIIFKEEKLNYVVIGDSLASGNTVYNINGYSFSDAYYDTHKDVLNDYNKDYAISNLTSRDLYDLIVSNDKIHNNDLNIKQIIGNANILVLAIGVDEIHNHQNIKLYLYYMELIITEIKKINNKNIYLLSLYSDNEKVVDINSSLKNLSIKYKISYIDIFDIYKENNIYENSIYLNIYGHEEIKNKLESVIIH